MQSARRLGPQVLQRSQLAVLQLVPVAQRPRCLHTTNSRLATVNSAGLTSSQTEQEAFPTLQTPGPELQQVIQPAEQMLSQQLDQQQQHAAGAASPEGDNGSIKKKVKRNVALHVGYVGTNYTGVDGCIQVGPAMFSLAGMYLYGRLQRLG